MLQWTQKEYSEKWRAEEEERHKGSLTPKKQKLFSLSVHMSSSN
jgi:hypothetical protein